MSVLSDSERLLGAFVRSGGKINRKQQRSRIRRFARFCDGQKGVYTLQQVGKRHVIQFYKQEIADLSDSGRLNYYYAIAALFEMSGKNKPPRPKNQSC